MTSSLWQPEAYNDFIRISNEKAKIIETLASRLSLLQQSIRRSLQHCLEIGPGPEPLVAKNLSSRFGGDYIAVEKYLPENFTRDDETPDNLVIVNKDYSEWLNTAPRRFFDVSIFSHSIYYFPDKLDTISKTLEVVDKNGEIYIIVNGQEENGDRDKMKRWFFGEVYQKYRPTISDVERAITHINCDVEKVEIVTELSFNSPEELRRALRLSFSNYIDEFDARSSEAITFIEKEFAEGKFRIPQVMYVLTTQATSESPLP